MKTVIQKDITNIYSAVEFNSTKYNFRKIIMELVKIKIVTENAEKLNKISFFVQLIVIIRMKLSKLDINKCKYKAIFKPWSNFFNRLRGWRGNSSNISHSPLIKAYVIQSQELSILQPIIYGLYILYEGIPGEEYIYVLPK